MAKKKDRDLPAGMYRKHGAFYLVQKNQWIRLGTDLGGSLIAYAKHREAAAAKKKSLKERSDIRELIDEAIEARQRQRKPLSENTLSQYETAARHADSLLGAFRIHQIESRDIAAIQLKMAHMPNMSNRVLSLLRLTLDYAVKMQMIPSNPCIGIKRLDEHQRDRYVSDDEYLAIHDAATPFLQSIMELCYLTAQRISDILRIERSHITDDGILFEQGKTGNRLMLRMTPDLADAVERAKISRKYQKEPDTLFATRRGDPIAYRTVKDMWNRACEAAKVTDAGLHDLRAKSVTDAEDQGLNPQLLAGHRDANMTRRYIRKRKISVADGPKILDKSKKSA